MIEGLIGNPERIAEAGRNASLLGRPHAAAEIVDIMLAGMTTR
jgi:hypothetical protein